jgi:four helix bundle protein
VSASETMLDHERLDVYQLARHFVREAHSLLRHLPSGRADLADPLRRASLSLPLNIAEGAGEFAPREKARFYRIAKRSATECGAVPDLFVDLDLLTVRQVQPGKILIRRIVGAMVKLILASDRSVPHTCSRAGASPAARTGVVVHGHVNVFAPVPCTGT